MGNAAPFDPEFFVSYTAADEGWAEWIAWHLQQTGPVALQKWHIQPGDDFVRKMHEFLSAARTVVLVLSRRALESEWVMKEVTSAIAGKRRLVPVRIEDCPRPGILAAFSSIDLFDVDPEEARKRLLAAVRPSGAADTAPAAPMHAADWEPGTAANTESKLRPGDLRRRLATRFDDTTFSAMCLDYFPEVYARFADGMTADRKQTLLLDHCRRRGLLGILARIIEDWPSE